MNEPVHDPLDSKWLADCYFDGLSYREIAELAGCHPRRVGRALRRIGLGCRPDESPPSTPVWRPPKLDDRAWLTANYPSRSATSIATELAVDAHTVLAALRRHGFEIMPAGYHLRNPSVGDERWLSQRLDEGLTQQQIADLAGCDQTVVSDAVERIGRRVPRTPGELADRDWLAAQVNAGHTDKEIAKQFGVHPGSVKRWRLRHHLYRRWPTPPDAAR